MGRRRKATIGETRESSERLLILNRQQSLKRLVDLFASLIPALLYMETSPILTASPDPITFIPYKHSLQQWSAGHCSQTVVW